MREDVDEDVVIVARVRLALVNGDEETWMAPMRLTDDAVSYAAAIYPPEGAVIVGVEPLKRHTDKQQEIVVARTDVLTL